MVSTRRRIPINWVSDRTLQPSIESVVANSFVPSDFLVDGQVSGLGTVHPLLTLNFLSAWILPLHISTHHTSLLIIIPLHYATYIYTQYLFVNYYTATLCYTYLYTIPLCQLLYRYTMLHISIHNTSLSIIIPLHYATHIYTQYLFVNYYTATLCYIYLYTIPLCQLLYRYTMLHISIHNTSLSIIIPLHYATHIYTPYLFSTPQCRNCKREKQ